MAPTVLPFSLETSKYDLTTYYGRWRHFVELVDPRTLFATEKEIRNSVELLGQFKCNTLDRQLVTDVQLWNARHLRDAVKHPQTGETLPALFRLAAFVPVNIPICCGMLLSAPTLPNVIFWQWFNQSYNAGFNYANRNASSSQEISSIMTAYCTATALSCVSAVGLGKLVEKASNLPTGMRTMIQRTVPFVAVAASGSLNAVFMRRNELSEGIDLFDDDGNMYGRSKCAAKKSLTEVALTRVAIPMPILLLPPYIMEAFRKMNLMPKNRYGRVFTELGCLWGAFPASVALFPQTGSILTTKLESQFQDLLDHKGMPITRLSYNKGV